MGIYINFRPVLHSWPAVIMNEMMLGRIAYLLRDGTRECMQCYNDEDVLRFAPGEDGVHFFAYYSASVALRKETG